MQKLATTPCPTLSLFYLFFFDLTNTDLSGSHKGCTTSDFTGVILIWSMTLPIAPENPELPPVKRVFCLAPLSRLRSPRSKINVPLSNPTAIKFRSSSTARAVGTCPVAWVNLNTKGIFVILHDLDA